MLHHLSLDQLICIDIETAPGLPAFSLLADDLKE